MKVGVRGKLFFASVGLVLVVIVVSGMFLERALKQSLISRIRSELIRHASAGKSLIENSDPQGDLENAPRLARLLSEATETRVTIIRGDGRVLGDSELSPERVSELENHRNRPEFRDAMKNGRGIAERFSETLEQNMLYVSVKYRRSEADGVIRVARSLAEVAETLDQSHLILLAAALIGLGVAVLTSAVTSNTFSRKLRSLVEHAHKMSLGGNPSRVVVQSADELGGLAGSLNRLSEQLEQRLAALTTERDRFEAVLDGMSEAVIAVDQGHRITLLNRAAEVLLNLTDNPLGNTLLETVRVPELHELVSGIDDSRELTAEFDLPGLRSKRVLARATKQGSGGHIVVLLDVTELRRLEKIRRDFVANVSHELRTPISVIRANTETLLGGALDDRNAAETFLRAMETNAERLSQLIADLLDISKIETGHYHFDIRSVGVRPALDRARESLLSLAGEKGTKITVSAQEELQALADAGALDQILYNLVDNALKYTPAGGNVAIRAVENEDRVLIEVQDDGPGVAPKHRERLFERFYRVDPGRSRAMGGTGLGLAIVKHLAAAMNGQVGMKSALPHGSVFWVTIPKFGESGEMDEAKYSTA